MTATAISMLKRLRWQPLLLAGLTAFLLRPLLKTGFVFDDATNSLFPGALRVEGYTFAEYLGVAVKSSMCGGRFFPLAWVNYLSMHYFVTDLVTYKALIVGLMVVDVVLFYATVRQLSRDGRFALFTACCLLPLFQFRVFYDPVLSFSGLLQVVSAEVLVSLLGLQLYLDTGRRRWLALGGAGYALALLTYEVVYPLVLLHLVLVWHGRRGLVARLGAAAPFVGVTGLCALASVVLRRLYLAPTSIYQVNKDPFVFLSTLARQTSAALPLSYYLRNHSDLFPAPDPVSLAAFVATAGGAVAFIGVLVPALWGLRGSAGGVEDAPGDRRLTGGRLLLLAEVGVLLALLPGALISTSRRYQELVDFGVGYLPVYLQYFGVGLLLGTLGWLFVTRMTPRRGLRRAAVVAVALLLAGVTSLTYRNNAVLADRIPKSVGAPGFSPFAGNAGGSWYDHRKNLEAALHGGLVDDVPEHARVDLANEYPCWHDGYHSRYFYAMHASRVLETVPRTSRFKGDYCWFIQKDTLRPAPAPASRFAVRDVPLGSKAGYVVLADVDPAGKASPSRLFVRHPGLYANGASPALVVTGAPTGGDGGGVALVGKDASVVRSGPDWALLDLSRDAVGVDPDSLAVSFGPTQVVWGDGFYGQELDEGRTFRWCQKRGEVVLTNATGSPRKVRLSLLVENRGNAPVLVDGSVRAEVGPAPAPRPLRRELVLEPGSHPLEFRTESPRVATGPHDPRDLHFRVIDLKVEDLGPATPDGPATSPPVPRIAVRKPAA